jgi:hypothetical protein
MEVLTIWRKQNTATRAVFPMYDHATGLLTTGVAGLDSEFALDGTHGGTAPSFADCEHETTEIGTTGIYYLDIAAGEVNDPNGSTINIKTTTEHVDPVCLRIQTLAADAVLTTAGVAAIATAVWTVATSALSTAGSVGKRFIDFVTTLVYAAPPAAAPSTDDINSALEVAHGSGAWGTATIGAGTTITQATIGTDGSPLGRVMPLGKIKATNGLVTYAFDADADGDFSYDLPTGSVWTMIAKAPAGNYEDAVATVSTIPAVS